MALAKYGDLGACKRLTFDSQEGNKFAYVKCTPDSKKTLDYLIEELAQMSSGSQEREQFQASSQNQMKIATMVNSSVEQAMGPMARL